MSTNGVSALGMSCAFGRVECARLCLRAGADGMTELEEGAATALELANRHQQDAIIAMLQASPPPRAFTAPAGPTAWARNLLPPLGKRGLLDEDEFDPDVFKLALDRAQILGAPSGEVTRLRNDGERAASAKGCGRWALVVLLLLVALPVIALHPEAFDRLASLRLLLGPDSATHALGTMIQQRVQVDVVTDGRIEDYDTETQARIAAALAAQAGVSVDDVHLVVSTGRRRQLFIQHLANATASMHDHVKSIGQ